MCWPTGWKRLHVKCLSLGGRPGGNFSGFCLADGAMPCFLLQIMTLPAKQRWRRGEMVANSPLCGTFSACHFAESQGGQVVPAGFRPKSALQSNMTWSCMLRVVSLGGWRLAGWAVSPAKNDPLRQTRLAGGVGSWSNHYQGSEHSPGTSVTIFSLQSISH